MRVNHQNIQERRCLVALNILLLPFHGVLSSTPTDLFFYFGWGGAESRPVEVSSGLVGGRQQESSEAPQPNTPLSSALCRPVQLYGPATRTSSSSCAAFPQTSSPLPPALCLPPYFPCFPGLICHCGLIISACSCTSSGRPTFLSGSAGLLQPGPVLALPRGLLLLWNQ